MNYCIKKLWTNKSKMFCPLIQQQMMVAFEDGEYSEFFRMWNRCIPDAVQETDEACHKLVFNMNIFFALHPITHGNQVL